MCVHGTPLPLRAIGSLPDSASLLNRTPVGNEISVIPMRHMNQHDLTQIRRARNQGKVSVQNKDLMLTFVDSTSTVIMAALSDKALQRAVPVGRVESFLSAPGRHYGIRDANEHSNAYNLGVGTALLGMTGIRKLASDPDDPRQLVIDNGEITDLYGRILFLNADRAGAEHPKFTIHPTGHRDWLVELRITHPDKGLFLSVVFGAK